MSASPINRVPFLKTTREFPAEDLDNLSSAINKAYLDIASAVNERTIGIYPVNRPALTGNKFFFTSKKQETLRQVYTFTAAGNIPHGINIPNIFSFAQAYGSFTDGTNYYGAIYASNIAIAGQVSFYITPTNIVILSGAGAPTIKSGNIVVEWVSQP